MKKWFYRNVVLVYVLTTASIIIIGVLCYLHPIVSEETYNALFSLALGMIFIIAISTVFVGIWGENKLEEIEKEKEI